MQASHPSAVPAADALAPGNTRAFASQSRVCILHRRELRPGGRVACPGSHSWSQLCLGLHGRRHHLSSHSMAPYKDTATTAPAPTFQPLPQFITCHPTVPIWTHTCTSTNVPVQGFENWVTCRERAIKKVYLGHRPGPESFLPHPTSSQAWDSGSCHLEAKSPPSLHHGAHVHPWGPADALAHFQDPPQDVCPPTLHPPPPSQPAPGLNCLRG